MEKAQLLNESYGLMFTADDGVIPDFPNKFEGQCDLDNIDFNSSVVYKQLRQLKPKTSSGPDGLSAMFLQKLSSSLALPLSILFKSFFFR